MINRAGLSLVSVLLAASMLTGCGEKATASQVAAKVNSDEITVNQLNYALANLPPTANKTSDAVKREVLDTLIVQKLADQKAISLKLDQNPAVIEAIENAKNTILARAYMDPVVASIPKPTAEEIHKFYTDHPELFSDRRIYTLQELEVPSQSGLAASIRERIAKGDGMDAIAAWLKDQKISASMHAEVKPAEQLPAAILHSLYKLPADKLMVAETSSAIWVTQAKDAKLEPVEESVATPVIQAYLTNQRKQEALDKEVKALKDAARIDYVMEFSKKAAVAETEKPAATPATPATTDVAKGVAGL